MESVKKKVSRWKFGGLTPIDLVKQTGKELQKDNVFGHSAELAYYFLLALFPLLLFVVTVLGFLSGPGSELRSSMFAMLGRVMPSSSGGLVQQTMDDISRGAGGGKAAFSLLGALWAASAGVTSLMEVLNVAYDVRETRGFVRKRVTAIGITI